MTCTRIPGGIICTSPYGRLHVKNRYIYMTFHEYCGPTFYTDRGMNNEYMPVPFDEQDPVWPVFNEWLKKFNAKKQKQLSLKQKRSNASANHKEKS